MAEGPQRVRLLNTTDRVLRLRFNGESIVFQPHGMPGSVHSLPKAAADYVKGQLMDQVEVVAEQAAISYVAHKAVQRYYLANFSGDPDSLEFFETESIGMDGSLQKKRVRNELHTPQVYKARLGRKSMIVDPGTHKYADPQTGKIMANTRPMQVTYPGQLLTIPPYTVVEVSKGQYNTILSSEYDRPADYPKFIRPSRPVGEFEPDYNNPWWTLNRLRTYLEMIPESNEREAGVVVAGPSEEELRRQLKAEDLDEDTIELRVEKARYETFIRCKIRCMDLSFVLPTRGEFDSYNARKGKAKKAESVST